MAGLGWAATGSAVESVVPQFFVAAGHQGALLALNQDGQPQAPFPLKHTDVALAVSGFLLHARVTQQFENPYKDTIEARYTFPLPQRAAVNDMALTVGDRLVKGKIAPREEAHALYEAARRQGQRAGLLDQERPNIFTQSIANILPGEKITVTLQYVEILNYEEGSYEVLFPTVVGPRYIPGATAGKTGGGLAQGTNQVPDATHITPPVTPAGTRAGHDISIGITVDAGMPLQAIQSPSHEIRIERPSPNLALVRLTEQAVIPNKDFILRYTVAGKAIQDAVLFHGEGRGGYFTLILQPPARIAPLEIVPKELVFVLDTSGSMSGFPLEKAKETMQLALDGLYPQDTFNLITFSGDTHILFREPVQATAENLRTAKEFLASRRGRGGTEMMEAIRAALEPSDSQHRIRIVCFMTDGFVGNDHKILAEIQKHPGARIFSFGIGSSVNRFLLDKMAEEGRGAVEYVSLTDDGSAAARRFHERVRNPLLTDVSIEWQGVSVDDLYPKRLADLFSVKPLILTGRYTEPGKGMVRLRGRTGTGPLVREMAIDIPAVSSDHGVVAVLWARMKIDELTAQDHAGLQAGKPMPAVRHLIQQLGLDHGLVTRFTSFVAVEEMTVTDGDEPRLVEVPVEMPEGVSYDGVFGQTQGEAARHQVDQSGRASSSLGGPFATVPHAQPCLGCRSHREDESREVRKPMGPAQTLQERLDREAVEADESTRHPLNGKLHPAVMAVVRRLEDKSAVSSLVENEFVRKGVAEIQIWLTNTSDETLRSLSMLGVTIVLQPKTGKIVLGRVTAERLAEIASLQAVRYLAPQPRHS
jgi:Ca-activated chloride channel family protein